MKAWALVILFMAVTGLSHAEEKPGTGVLVLEDETGQVQPALLRDVAVEIEIQGVVAHVNLRQAFTNVTDQWVEGLYQLPMPEQARTDSVVLEYGDTRLQGQIQPRAQAQANHEQARREGRRSALVSWQQPGLFQVRAANIPPAETVVVEISWVQPARWVHGGFELRLPLTYTPRYGRSEEAVHLPAGTHEDALVMPQFSLQAHLQAGLALQQVSSLYHEIMLEVLSEQEYHLQLARGLEAANRDFVLRWEPEVSDQPVAALYHQERGEEQYWALLLVPQQVSTLPQVAREMIFVVDVSGSMQGASMEQARAALLDVLDQLQADDYLNIIAFSSDYQPLWPESQPVSEDTLQQARAFVQSLQADGGTEMLPAMRFALSQPVANGLLRQVVFLTDGAVSRPQELYRLVKFKAGDSRVFPVGIGAAPNTGFMQHMARMGRGTATEIGDIAEVGQRVEALFSQLRSPALQDIEIGWPKQSKGQAGRVPDLYLGQPVWQVVRTEGPMPALLQINGQLGKQPWLRAVETAHAQQSPWLFKLWAGDYLQQQRMALELEEVPEGQRDHLVAELTDLALEAGLVSPWTSFVMEAEERIRPEEAELVQQDAANAHPSAPMNASAQKVRRAATLALPQTELNLQGYVILVLLGGFMLLVNLCRKA